MKNDMYVLAYEVRNPLCIAKGYLEMLNTSNFEKYKKIIKKEIQNSLEILDNYLEYDSFNIHKEEIDFNLLLHDIKEELYDYFIKEGINLKISFKEDEVYLKADFYRLKQAINHLLDYAVKRNSKKITVSYKVLYDEIRIMMNDDGNNIDNLNILNSEIGIKIAKKIITLHDGKIVFNKELRGNTLIITLPLS